ncbi:MAG: hypothetical protein IJP29_00520 [Lachnospiraceae bacterium]|nr:hypothetical protein [Lachnospiraceae bacterium]
MKKKTKIIIITIICIVLVGFFVFIGMYVTGMRMSGDSPSSELLESETTEDTTTLLEGTYYMSLSGEDSAMLAPCLTIDKHKQFTFTYDYSSSYLSMGFYSIKDGIMTARTSDGLYEYRFEVREDGTLAFIQEGSADISYYDHKVMSGVQDGSVFMRKNK